MPGINSKNVYAVMNRVESIAQLVTLTVDELTDILSSSSNAKQLYDFIHTEDQLQTKSHQTSVKQTVAAARKETSGRGIVSSKRSKK
ncbi:MAG: hypothetical protein MUE72_06870 [Chitinophagaceae bacterium]|nr:hypothetical protein [Chitinophagaceae bacterium]